MHPTRHILLALAAGLLLALTATAAMAQNMGGGMGGSSVSGAPQGYITAPPTLPNTPVQPRQPPAGEDTAMTEAEQPDKCKTCVNCLTDSCRRLCWQRYCRR